LPSTPILGRDEEIAGVERILSRVDVRLLTLVGPPGIGKTRLAAAAGERLTSSFADGVVLVDLVPIRDAGLVPYAIAQALGVADAPRRPIMKRLTEALEDKQLLLIADNFEHVLDAARQVAEVLAACSGVKILATSREPLHLTWEREFPVPPLPLPDLDHLRDVKSLAACPSVALFLERAQAVRPDLGLTSQNARVIGELCVRLDGLPLAIEMAAAQAKVLTPEMIARRLDQGLEVLVGRARDLPARHRTLRAAIGWSYDLLGPGEQALFRRLAVFPGGCTSEAAAAVCDGDLGIDLASGLAALVDKSLLRHEPMSDGTARFGLLESLREYGMERLAETGELNRIRRLHADFFLALVERAEPELRGHRQSSWLSVLDAEYPNVIAAMQSYLTLGDIESGMRLASALWWFWDIRIRWTEGREWLERMIAAGRGAPEAMRAKVIYAAGHLAFHRRDLETMARYIEESLALYRRLGDERGLAETLWMLGWLTVRRGDVAGGVAVMEDGLASFRKTGDPWGIAQTLFSIASQELSLGNYERARSRSEEGLAIARQFSMEREVASHLLILGSVARDLGETIRSKALLEESLALCRRLGNRVQDRVPGVLMSLAMVLRDRGDHQRADRLLEESLLLLREQDPEGRTAAHAISLLGIGALRQQDRRRAVRLLREGLALHFKFGMRLGVATCLEALAEIDAHRHPTRAARLFGAADALREAIGVPVAPADRGTYDGTVATVRTRLGAASFDAEWAAGHATPMDEAVAMILSEPAPADASADATAESPADPLSRREREVAMLIAQGLSNRQIAAALFVAETTAESHVQSIFNKLGFNKRAQVAAWMAVHRPGSA
jgi:predicted ATPase/DNA-binding CsgD family transcriptional regulator/tetratricopeptide (TPR) repeat protein